MSPENQGKTPNETSTQQQLYLLPLKWHPKHPVNNTGVSPDPCVTPINKQRALQQQTAVIKASMLAQS